MAFRSNGLSALSYANGFTLWHYRTTDLATDVDTVGYFNAGAAMLRLGDFLIVSAGPTGNAAHGLMVVLANNNGVVDVGNLTNMAAANSD
jgi:hypothetical protein